MVEHSTRSPGPTPASKQRQVQRGRSRRQRHRVAGAEVGRELLLEGVDVRAERRDPVRVEGVEQQRPLLLADVRGRQVDPQRWLAGAHGSAVIGA
jgi:hypothetical protein